MDFFARNLITVFALMSPFILWFLYKAIILPMIEDVDSGLNKLGNMNNDLDKKSNERKERMERIRKDSKKD